MLRSSRRKQFAVGIFKMARLYTMLMMIEDDKTPKERIFRNRDDAFCLSDETFISIFRLPKDLVKIVCEELRPDLANMSYARTALSVETQVLCTLSFFASGSYQGLIGRDYLVALSQSSVSRCIKKVCKSLNERLFHREISFPSPDEYPAIKLKFMEDSGFPGIIGAVDCTPITIIAPPQPLEECYIHRKNIHAINVQLVCDADLRILNINAKHPGQTHDAFIWKFSRLREILQNEHTSNATGNSWLLGDSGYPLEPWLMTPFFNPQTDGENRFNSAHCKARNAIERCNGVLKSRFRCLSKHRVLNLSPTMASHVINACAILHNLCVRYRIDFEEDDEEIDEDDDDDSGDLSEANRNSALFLRANAVRKQIIRNHFS